MSRPNIVVLGTGFGGLECAFDLRRRIGNKGKITLVSDHADFNFKPNTIYIPFGEDPAHYVIPLADGMRRRDIDFLQTTVTGVDPAAKRVFTRDGQVAFDELVIATGATMSPDEIPGMREYANTIWAPEDMLRLRGSFDQLLGTRAGRPRTVLFVVPPQNKCSGPLYEIVLMLDTWLRRQGARDRVRIIYNTYEQSFIQAFGPRLHEVVTNEFSRRNIEGNLDCAAAAMEPNEVLCRNGSRIPYDLLISFPPYKAAVHYDSLPSDDRGFLLTDAKTRQVQGCANIYAVGDGGDFPVKQAFLALLQADAVSSRLAECVLGKDSQAVFDPVSMCIMEQFDKATFAQVPLRLTGNPDRPVAVRDDCPGVYQVGSGPVWRLGKKMLGTVLPARFRAGRPFHAGPSWTAMEAGLKVMAAAFAK